MDLDEFKKKSDEIKSQLEEENKDEAEEDLFDFDAVIDISVDGEAEVEEIVADVTEAQEEISSVNADESDAVNISESYEVSCSECADGSDESQEACSSEIDSESDDANDSSSETSAESFENKINRGVDAMKGFFSSFASKVSQKADELQAKEKMEKFAGAVGNKFESVAKSVENKFNKNNAGKTDSAEEKEAEAEECTGDCAECEVCDTAFDKETTEVSDEIEHVEGQVVGTMEDKFDQFKKKVSDTAKAITPVVSDAAKTVAPKVKEAAISVKESAKELAPKVKDKAIELAPKVKDAAKSIGPKVKDMAKGLGPKVKETAEDVAPKVKETAKSVGPKVKEKAKNVADTISFEGYRLKHNVKKKIKKKIKEKVLGKTDEDGQNIRVKKVKHYSSNFMNHAATITQHRHLVIKHCFRAGIPLQGLTHDLSKYSPSEFKYGVKYFSGDRSPNEGEREAYGYSNAWMHHKGRNKHHFEYWLDYNIEANKAMPVKMPLKYVIEMFCDRVAAGKIYKKEAYDNMAPYEYFDKNRTRRNIHPETSAFLEKLLKMLAVKGEDYTFTYIKWYLKHHDTY